VSRAIHHLRQARIPFTEHPYRYEAHGGTATAARELGVDEHAVVKTLVLEDDRRRALLMLMHGDREVSTKRLARAIGARSVTPCAPEAAERHTGYLIGGISPFGTRKPLPVYLERSILALDRLYINGGRRGLLVALAPGDLMRTLSGTAVDAAQEEARDDT
jgi:Cys-tRNA(Pro) deacylase